MFDILEDDRFIKMASSLGQNKTHTSMHTRYSFSVSFLSLSTKVSQVKIHKRDLT